MSKWESGKNNFPSFKATEQLFELGITVEELFGIEYNTMHNLVDVEAVPISSIGDLREQVTIIMKKLDEFESLKSEFERIKKRKEPAATAQVG